MESRLNPIMYDRPNWQQMLLEVGGCGFTTTEIGLLLKTSQSQISRLQRGQLTNPTHEIGYKIIELHNREMRRFEKRIKRNKLAWKV